MSRPIRTVLSCLALLVIAGTASAKTGPPISIPASAETAKQRLSASPRHGEWADITVPGSDAKVHSWVVYPERKGKAPVVIVIHEIFGLSDWIRSVADQLAAEGFIALAPDLLSGKGPDGGGTDSFPEGAAAGAIFKLDPAEVAARLDAVRGYGLSLPSASSRSSTIGFCWGGMTSFAYAARQPALNAAVVYYGTPPANDALPRIKAPLMGFYGGDDARVTSTVEGTQKSMAELKKPYVSHVYAGAGHGFLRQQTGRDGANLKAAQGAWMETIRFLKKSLK